MKVILSQQSQTRIGQLENALPQAILLSGPIGVGLGTISRQLAQIDQAGRIITPQLLKKTSTVAQISIDMIRELYADTRGVSSRQQVIIIDDADTMTLSAQNAFLKLLEEPHRHVHFILTSHRPERLLPTIRSRVQTFDITPMSDIETDRFLQSHTALDAKKRTQLQFIANGLPAELTRLISDKSYFEATVERMTFAKKILEADSYRRLVYIMQTKLDRAEALALLRAMTRLLERTIRQQDAALLSRLLMAYDRIEHGGNQKLQLAHSMI